jgi:hypothetical protein
LTVYDSPHTASISQRLPRSMKKYCNENPPT